VTAVGIDAATSCTPQVFYPDADGDGYGDSAARGVESCDSPAGAVLNHSDCDDGNADVNPGAQEQCNERDDNCSGGIDEGFIKIVAYPDLDGDGYGSRVTAAVEVCQLSAGLVANSLDCADDDARAHPGATTYYDTPIVGTTQPPNAWDFNCDGTARLRYPNAGVCQSLEGSSGCYRGGTWWGSVPGCGQIGNLLTHCGSPPNCSFGVSTQPYQQSCI
jgi:hypothetical protein